MSKVVAASEAVARIADGAVVTVSSSSALGCPDLVLRRSASASTPRATRAT